MAKIDKTYHELLQYILDNGRLQDDPNRKGVKRLNVTRYTFKHDLRTEGFPAITTKQLYWKGVVGELIWFLRGDTNIKYLLDNNIHIWDKDLYNFRKKQGIKMSYDNFYKMLKDTDYVGNGDLGRIYGAQWRDWYHNIESTTFGNNGEEYSYVENKSIDQIANLIKNLKEKPLSTEHIVTAWNPAELDEMALPPCHKGFQLMVYELSQQERLNLYVGTWHKSNSDEATKRFLKGKNIPKYGFDLVWEQRSVDTFLGLPFNIASYALLAHIIGKIVNMVPSKIYGDLRNVHIYDNAIDAVKEQLSRDVNKYSECNLDINENIDIDIKKYENNIDMIINRLKISDFKLNNYKSYPPIKTEMLSRD